MNASHINGRVLIVAGSDSGGGAGIQGDIKTVTALGGYAASAITALTAQNTQGVQGIETVTPEFVVQQMASVLSDIGADAVKTGMLLNDAIILSVSETLRHLAPAVPLVLDPVMVAKGGATLLERAAIQMLKERLLPMAALVTPNIPEAEMLTGLYIADEGGMRRAGDMLRKAGAKAVLIKGGHLKGDEILDVLCTEEGFQTFKDSRIDSRNTHGTGCTLASAIATGLAQKMKLPEAVERARRYVREAIRSARPIGSGHGPLNHGHTVGLF